MVGEQLKIAGKASTSVKKTVSKYFRPSFQNDVSVNPDPEFFTHVHICCEKFLQEQHMFILYRAINMQNFRY